ncbi:hypothetical protein [Methylopila sp. M107]|uniref:hypothetical protein n=1 Tax=Methylopila sp. M107 TaxID=1101190 RepID=UPI00037DBA27|nr:hypothetical protein [Methylopila sp. M107]
MTLPRGARSIMASRREPPTSLDFFPTPPWATRAFVEFVLTPALGGDHEPADLIGRDPCCGEGHMVETLKENLCSCQGSDVFDYGRGYEVLDALEPQAFGRRCDLVAMNPPYNIAQKLVTAALEAGEFGELFWVFALVRSAWLEGETRFEQLFSKSPPDIYAPYVERVPMFRGRYDPKGRGATAYSWIGWTGGRRGYLAKPVTFIPPCRKRLETIEDIRRWCPPADAPLFEGVGA